MPEAMRLLPASMSQTPAPIADLAASIIQDLDSEPRALLDSFRVNVLTLLAHDQLPGLSASVGHE